MKRNVEIILRALLLAVVLLIGDSSAQTTFLNPTLEVRIEASPFVFGKLTPSSVHNFSSVPLAGINTFNVPLTWQSAGPSYLIENFASNTGWSITLQLVGGTLNSGGNMIQIEYGGGTGVVTAVGDSDPVNPGDSNISGSLNGGLKVVSIPSNSGRGRYNYQLGTFTIPNLPANQPPGLYTGTLMITGDAQP